MSLTYNVNELVEQVRENLDEFNVESVTDGQILNSLNLAQKDATRITVRRLDEIFLHQAQIDVSSAETGIDGTVQYDMPRDVFGRRIEKVELREPGSNVAWKLKPLSYQQRDPYVTTSQVARPYYYDIVNTKIRLYPPSSSVSNLFVYYSKSPERLVVSQGQVNTVDTTNNYILVDDIGSELSVESDDRASFVNIVDFTTGEVKQTLQIAFIDTTIGQIKFKSSGLTRTTVFNKPIEAQLSDDVQPDDYICLVKGVCVPQLPDAYTDYIVQHAVNAQKRRFREPTQEDIIHLQRLEKEILKALSVGREAKMRIRRQNRHLTGGGAYNLKQFFT